MYNQYRKAATTPSSRKQSKLSYVDRAERMVRIKRNNIDTGITETVEIPLAIIKPIQTYKPVKEDVAIFDKQATWDEVSLFLQSLEGPVALDIETNGVEAHSHNQYIVGIGLASDSMIGYFSLEDMNSKCVDEVLLFCKTYDQGFVVHNAMFECAWFLSKYGIKLNVIADTYALAKHLMNEGPHILHGLKHLQQILLGWEEKGDTELDKWLVEHGHITSFSKDKKPDSYPVVKSDGSISYAKARKSEMYLAPADILGFYCGLDSASTYQLYTEVFLPAIEGHNWADTYFDYHRNFLINVHLLAKQQILGVTIDKDKLEKYEETLAGLKEEKIILFMNEPEIVKFNKVMQQEALAELNYSEPEVKFKKLPKLGKEPPQRTKSGDINKNWTNWNRKRKELQSIKPEYTNQYVVWHRKIIEAEQQVEWLNMNSVNQLQRLFYGSKHEGGLELPIKVRTMSGAPATGKEAYPTLGKLGKLLKSYKDTEKEHGYVKKCIEMLQQGPDGEYRIHPQFKAPGTLTGRLAGGGGLNLQQLPKSGGYLECWRPAKGTVWLDLDFSSLENVVIAELSEDNSMMKLYGPDAPPEQDAYLFNGADLPIIGPKIRAAGYDPERPTKEMIDKVKKECKTERSISKILTLSASYGAGSSKIQQSLELLGVPLTMTEAQELHQGFWQLYRGIKEWEQDLKKEWRRNNGWVLNGVGRPVCCDEGYIKDIVNRVGQSTGHDVLMKWAEIYTEMLDAAGIDWQPVILDFHDESIIQINNKSQVTKAMQIFQVDSLRELNKWLGGIIPMKLDGGVIKTLAEAKVEGWEGSNNE